MKPVVSAAATLAFCMLLSGCPESVHPLSDPAAAAQDPAVFGVWRGMEHGPDVWLHIGPLDRGMTAIVRVQHDLKRNEMQVARYTAFPTRIGKLNMANLEQLDRDDGLHSYFFARYQVTGAQLTLQMLSVDAVTRAVKGGGLAGRTDSRGIGEILVTAPGEALVRFLREGKVEDLFEKPMVYRRVGPR